MNTKFDSTRRSLSTLLLILLVSLALNTDNAYSEPQYLINDDFSGEELDLSVWNFRTHADNNAYYEMGDGIISIHSGTTWGSGGSIRSLQQFTPGEEVLIFETRARTTYADGGWWGFFGENHDGVVLIGYNYGVLRTAVRPATDAATIHVEFPEIQIEGTEWHTFRIELSNDYAKFFVDGELILTQTDNIPKGKYLYVWVGRVSYGVDQIAYFDYVRLQSIPNVIDVQVDIKPGSYPNSINPRSNGNVPVAILGSDDFDVASVDISSILFAGAEVHRSAFEDVNIDGFDDLVLHFLTRELNFNLSDEYAILTGLTHDGVVIQGEDSINLVP